MIDYGRLHLPKKATHKSLPLHTIFSLCDFDTPHPSRGDKRFLPLNMDRIVTMAEVMLYDF